MVTTDIDYTLIIGSGLVVEYAKLIEQILVSWFGIPAEWTFSEKVKSMKCRLNRATVKKMFWVVDIRNKVGHKYSYEVANVEDFILCCKEIIAFLEKIKQKEEAEQLEKITLKEALFPLYNVTLGETTVEELSRLGERSNPQYDYFRINGQDFWYDNNTAWFMCLICGFDPMPSQWKKIGFEWELSYNQWKTLLDRFKWNITIVEAPCIKQHNGQDCFSAQFYAISREYKITFDFKNLEATSTNSPSTLYSLTIYTL